jgi:hypothetical protein
VKSLDINEIANKHEHVIDYIDSQFVIHILTGQEIDKDVMKINDNTILVRYEFDNNCPVNSIKLYLRGKDEEIDKSALHLSIGNWSLDGHKMRSQLLAAGIPKYKKSKHKYGHHYRFELNESNQVETIFEVFKNFLPK